MVAECAVPAEVEPWWQGQPQTWAVCRLETDQGSSPRAPGQQDRVSPWAWLPWVGPSAVDL